MRGEKNSTELEFLTRLQRGLFPWHRRFQEKGERNEKCISCLLFNLQVRKYIIHRCHRWPDSERNVYIEARKSGKGHSKGEINSL